MIVEVVGAVILDKTGRLLVVRKRGASRYILPGGKREPGEPDLAALARELDEELGVRLVTAEPLGLFQADAANEPGARVRSHAYLATIAGEISIAAEIDDRMWIDPSALPTAPLAPLLTGQILPAINARRAARPSGSR